MSENKNTRVDSARAFGKKRTKKSTSTGNSNSIPIAKGAKTSKKRVGQGPGSGMGKTSTRGSKGQKARNTVRRGFEGGQLPLHRRLPKRGFTSRNHLDFQAVNLLAITKAGISGVIGAAELKAKNLIKDENKLIKILGTGEINVAIEITADGFSASAKEKIEKAGGKAILKTVEKKEK
ncbi:50S ribosomal protein L15 [Leptospira sp. GIMC2001]|uniref:50S ribosomal protein L15 n=1 Tax=Leptospira sp. GIMC2001 TaxID=1513297 RepID=UPI002348FE4E|nr:50S ribosomal protein L15 [Leptospira sp. GIMC2001]WCL51099.1 50S ribosomal protein L15 [Leptospira sp. GIMC2001]